MQPFEVTIHATETFQRIHSFGAADAWGAQVVGLWEERHKEKIADLLFTSHVDGTGNPMGIGLSCWRVLAGAGSLRTQDITDPWRRTDTYLVPTWKSYGIGDDRSYDFSRCAGQRWFLHSARKHGVPHYVLCCHSPPAGLTANGMTHLSSRDTYDPMMCNLRGEEGLRAREFSVYLAKVLSHFNKLGIEFCAVAPVNEPNWRWDHAAQEGCSYTNDEIRRVASALEVELSRRRLQTSVSIPEAGCIDYLYEKVQGRERYSDFIGTFYGDGSIEPPEKLRIITGHSYFSCWLQEDRLVGSRERLADALEPLRKHGVEYWATEYSLYIPTDQEFVPRAVSEAVKGNGRDGAIQDRLGIDAALWCARVIHMDLVVAGASAWHWWLAISTMDQPDGLIRVDPSSPGNVTVTKTFWALGHYSLFVRPGMYRVAVDRSDERVERETANGLMVSAYTGEGRVVVVIINTCHIDQDVRIGVDGIPRVLPSATWFTAYITSNIASLSPYDTLSLGETLSVPRRSIVTAVGEVVNEGSLFYLVSASTERVPLCLEVAQASDLPHAVVTLGRFAGRAHQQWMLRGVEPREAGGGHVHLAAAHSGLVLEVVNASTVPRSPLHQANPSLSDAQQWMISKVVNGCVYVTARHSHHVLESYGNAVRVNVRSGRPEQQWKLVAVDSDLSALYSNPASLAAHTAAATAAAWGGQWADEVPPSPRGRTPRFNPASRARDTPPPPAPAPPAAAAAAPAPAPSKSVRLASRIRDADIDSSPATTPNATTPKGQFRPTSSQPLRRPPAVLSQTTDADIDLSESFASSVRTEGSDDLSGTSGKLKSKESGSTQRPRPSSQRHMRLTLNIGGRHTSEMEELLHRYAVKALGEDPDAIVVKAIGEDAKGTTFSISLPGVQDQGKFDLLLEGLTQEAPRDMDGSQGTTSTDEDAGIKDRLSRRKTASSSRLKKTSSR